MIPAVVGCFQMRWVTTLRPSVHIMIRVGRLAFELPQILQFMEVGHGLGVPFLGFLGWDLGGAHIYGHLAGQPEIRVAGHVDCADREVRVWRRDSTVAWLKRRDAAKFAKISFRCVENILEIPAGTVLLVLTLRERRNSEKTGKKERKEARDFYVHDVPALAMRQTCAASKDRAGSAQAAASAYFYRLQLRTNYPAVGKERDGD